jgi:hypothetical protein
MREEGATVTILASTGLPRLSPNAVGLPRATGTRPARERGPRGTGVRGVLGRAGRHGHRPEPDSGEHVADDSVRLNVSKGTGLVDAPSLVGLTRADAEAQLSAPCLEANVFEVPSIEPAGRVVAQNPVGGQLRQGKVCTSTVGGTPPQAD